MEERPILNENISSEEFLNYYYLKAELVDFCREQGLQSTGGKRELTECITYFLKSGEKLSIKHMGVQSKVKDICLDTQIEGDFVCSEKHRVFYKEHIGKTFSFNVQFQKWLKTNAGKTYKESIEAYYEILELKKTEKSTIDKQFEYNIYIRDFFEDNRGKSLKDAISCWKYKKSLKGHNRYERSDLNILD